MPGASLSRGLEHFARPPSAFVLYSAVITLTPRIPGATLSKMDSPSESALRSVLLWSSGYEASGGLSSRDGLPE